jgi:hypothetical protein
MKNERLDYLTRRAFIVIAELHQVTEEHREGHIRLTVSNLLSRLRDYKEICEGTSGTVHQGTLDLLETQIVMAEDFLTKYRQHEGSKEHGKEKDSILASKRIFFDSLDGIKTNEIFGGF